MTAQRVKEVVTTVVGSYTNPAVAAGLRASIATGFLGAAAAIAVVADGVANSDLLAALLGFTLFSVAWASYFAAHPIRVKLEVDEILAIYSLGRLRTFRYSSVLSLMAGPNKVAMKLDDRRQVRFVSRGLGLGAMVEVPIDEADDGGLGEQLFSLENPQILDKKAIAFTTLILLSTGSAVFGPILVLGSGTWEPILWPVLVTIPMVTTIVLIHVLGPALRISSPAIFGSGLRVARPPRNLPVEVPFEQVSEIRIFRRGPTFSMRVTTRDRDSWAVEIWDPLREAESALRKLSNGFGFQIIAG